MDDFEKSLANQLKPKPETVTLERILNFYIYIKSQNFSGSIIFYRGEHSAWINTHGNGVFEGHGATIDDALTDIMNHLQTKA